MAKTIKNLYRGTFNYQRSVIILYRHARSMRQAWLIMCRYLAERDGVNPRAVMGLFDGSRDNFSIALEIEMKEI